MFLFLSSLFFSSFFIVKTKFIKASLGQIFSLEHKIQVVRLYKSFNFFVSYIKVFICEIVLVQYIIFLGFNPFFFWFSFQDNTLHKRESVFPVPVGDSNKALEFFSLELRHNKTCSIYFFCTRYGSNGNLISIPSKIIPLFSKFKTSFS